MVLMFTMICHPLFMYWNILDVDVQVRYVAGGKREYKNQVKKHTHTSVKNRGDLGHRSTVRRRSVTVVSRMIRYSTTVGRGNLCVGQKRS